MEIHRKGKIVGKKGYRQKYLRYVGSLVTKLVSTMYCNVMYCNVIYAI